jgi:pimeloyl-ACP methyl ester carboxylesterase
MTTKTDELTAKPPLVEQAVLDDLRRRLRETNRVRVPEGTGWQRGIDTDYLAELVFYWAASYDWRAHEERIRSLPWATVDIAGTNYRVLHQESSPEAATVVLLHGWPDSVLRYERALPLMGDLNVVVPALPGFPFAPPLIKPGMSATAMAEIVEAVMSELGYHKYIVSGGDVGSLVAERLAVRAPHSVSALHLTDVPYTHLFTVDNSELTPTNRPTCPPVSDGR